MRIIFSDEELDRIDTTLDELDPARHDVMKPVLKRLNAEQQAFAVSYLRRHVRAQLEVRMIIHNIPTLMAGHGWRSPDAGRTFIDRALDDLPALLHDPDAEQQLDAVIEACEMEPPPHVQEALKERVEIIATVRGAASAEHASDTLDEWMKRTSYLENVWFYAVEVLETAATERVFGDVDKELADLGNN